MYRFVLPAIICFGCADDYSGNSSNENQNLPDSSQTLVSDSIVIQPDTLAPENLVSIEFTYSGSYCNGAYPSDEVLEEIKRPQPLSEINILLRGDFEFGFKTDKAGEISAVLDPGKYKVFMDRGNNAETAPFNTACEAYYNRDWGTLRIDSIKTDYKVHIEFPCDLCDPDVKKRP